MWIMVKEFFVYYIIYPVLFLIIYGGMLVALVVNRMREDTKEEKLRRFGF
jgi:hypothetical protein